jgi:hypothetical protein
MACWNKLVQALGIPAKVDNPSWEKTKGEMVAECANRQLLVQLMPKSISCSSPTKGRWQGRGVEHCGYCLPCLIRRAAILRALRTDSTVYTATNLTSHVLDTRQAEGQQVRSFQLAINRLNQRPNLAVLLIHKSGPLADQTPAEMSALAEVYRRGLNEVAALLATVNTRPS